MIRHTVVFRLKHPRGSKEEKAFLDHALLLKKIPGVEKFEQLRQVSRKNDYTFGFSMEFADAAAYLARAEDHSFDVVLFDPMFGRPRKSSAAFAAMRRHADHSPLTAAMLEDARRVARRRVVVKGSRYSSDFKALGLLAAPARPNATVLWATLPPRT